MAGGTSKTWHLLFSHRECGREGRNLGAVREHAHPLVVPAVDVARHFPVELPRAGVDGRVEGDLIPMKALIDCIWRNTIYYKNALLDTGCAIRRVDGDVTPKKRQLLAFGATKFTLHMLYGFQYEPTVLQFSFCPKSIDRARVG